MMKKRTIIASTVFASLFMCAGGLIACDDNSGVGGGYSKSHAARCADDYA